MLRVLSAVAGFLTLASAFALYGLKYDTGRLDGSVQAMERAVEKLEADIAVLKAEKAYLARPERLEKLARARGLQPIREKQVVRTGESVVPALRIGAAAISRDPAATR